MASVSITNQTLTLTIDINGVETVIRKDNCKVVAIGDVVRITDYRGSIYEFLFRDCTAPDEASANDLRDAIEVFLNTAGGGGGGGLSSIESTTLDVSIADGVATVDGIGGGYEPTITNEAGLSSTTVTAGFYSRTGNIVTGSFTIELELEALSTNGTLDFSLPILPDANFANRKKLTGLYSVNDGLLSNVSLGVLASKIGAKTGSFELQVSVAGVTVGLNIVIQYSLV
jgi:hypothetical protein